MDIKKIIAKEGLLVFCVLIIVFFVTTITEDEFWPYAFGYAFLWISFRFTIWAFKVLEITIKIKEIFDKNFKRIKISLIFLAILGVLMVIGGKIFSSVINHYPNSTEPVYKLEKLTNEDNTALEEKLNEITVIGTHKYTIQVAEYADEAAAMTFINDLKSKGFDGSVTTIYRGADNTRPFFKINVGAFDSFNEARLFNQQFREKTNINDSFIREEKINDLEK